MFNKLRNALWLVLGAVVAVWAVTSVVDLVRAGPMNPPGAPGYTHRPLDDIPPSWHMRLDATNGDPTTGCDSDRFECVLYTNVPAPGDYRAVLDHETGLVWTRDASGTTDWWEGAMYRCLGLELGYRKGWRLPTLEELMSLADPIPTNPALPIGHPFTGVQNDQYWTATDVVDVATGAHTVNMADGSWDWGYKDSDPDGYTWCVRGGQGRITE